LRPDHASHCSQAEKTSERESKGIGAKLGAALNPPQRAFVCEAAAYPARNGSAT
jgi:hypothetical protein